MTMKSVDLPHLRSVVLAGHVGSGKTTLAEQLLFKAGAIPRLGRVDDGTAHLDFEPEEQKRRESLSLAVGTFESDGTRISLVDTPGYPDFVADVIEGFAAADGAVFVMDASGGVEAGLEQAVALGRGDRHGGVLLHQQERPRERRPDGRARRPARGLRREDRAAPDRHRGGRVVQRLRRPRPSQGVELGRIEGSRDPHPGRPGRRGRATARPAARGRRRGRRRRAEQVPRGRGDLRPRARGLPPQGRQGERPGARPGRQRGEGHRPARAPRRDRALPPLPGRRAAGQGDRQGRRDRGDRRRRGRTAPGARVQDHRGPVRRTADVPARPVRDAALPGPHLERDAGRGRADRAAAAPPRQGAGADRRAEGRRDRGDREARGDRDRRHAVLEGEAPHARADRVPGAVAGAGHRTGLEGRPRQDGPGPPADARGGADGPPRTDAARRAGPADDGRGAHRRSSPSGSSASSGPRS